MLIKNSMTLNSKVSKYLPTYIHTYRRPICVRLKRLYNLGSGGRKVLKEMVPYVEKEEVPDCDYEKYFKNLFLICLHTSLPPSPNLIINLLLKQY